MKNNHHLVIYLNTFFNMVVPLLKIIQYYFNSLYIEVNQYPKTMHVSTPHGIYQVETQQNPCPDTRTPPHWLIG